MFVGLSRFGPLVIDPSQYLTTLAVRIDIPREGDPSKVRLHELTEEDLIREVVKKLTQEEKEHIVLNHVRKIGSQAFEKHFDDQVEALAANWKLDPR